MKERGSGILLHITSLPSPFGIGDLGPWAYRFADFLAQAGQRYWQILPLNPTDPVSGHSPYSSISAFAGNTLLISPEILIASGLLTREDVADRPSFSVERCDYASIIPYKERLLHRASLRFKKDQQERSPYEAFCAENESWLDDYALFVVIKHHSGGKAWVEWEEGLRDRDPRELAQVKDRYQKEVEREKFLQYLFFQQWAGLKRHCNGTGIQFIGDIPIYVNHDSADVWTHPEIFKLDEHKRPISVAGVPPDYFSKTGQRWGNPIFRWEELRDTGFRWWFDRLGHNLYLFDIVRVDHFRGFVGFWEIPAEEKTAVKGRWVKAPAVEFFTTLLDRYPAAPLIAEDLGVITPDVKEVMARFGFPGMRVLMFAFGEDLPTHSYLPHNHVPNCIVYTGTHDNNTVRGWFENEASPQERGRVLRYLGREVPEAHLHREMIRLAMMSVANTVIVPMQDLLGLSQEARMNRPSTTGGNWEWRLAPYQLTASQEGMLRELTCTYGRASKHFLDHRDAEDGGFTWPGPSHEGELETGPVTGPWPRHPIIYEINTWVWLHELSRRHQRRMTLGKVPPKEWDAIASWGIDAVWLMGVWERSPMGIRIGQEHPGLQEDYRRALPDVSKDDVVGSPYCVHRYVVDEHLGGPDGLAAAREMLAQRGMRLILDLVPNHVAPDHPWVTEHPDYFIPGDRADLERAPAEFFEAGRSIVACGRDPFFPPWTDTAQLNAFHPGLRQAAIETIRSIADQCGGIRCDMAMLLLNRIFEMTWGGRAGSAPSTEYWSEIIEALRLTHPDVLLIAEVYWGLESDLHQLGFDCCYDKVLYDRLVHDPAEGVQHHLLTDVSHQERLVRFLENHDEPRAAATFSLPKHRAAAVTIATLPGAKLLHDGQFDGRRIKLPIQLGRRPEEPTDPDLHGFYRKLLNAVRSEPFMDGEWRLCDRGGWPDNTSYLNLVAWCWQKEGGRCLIVVNLSDARAQGRIRIPWDDLAGRLWRLIDGFTGERYERDGSEMRDPGLFVDIAGWGFHFLRFSS